MDNLPILSALAKIKDIQDFRLRDFMSQLGLDPRQPATFYRELLKESRDAMRLFANQQNQLNARDESLCEYETEAPKKEQQIADLKTKMSAMKKENQQRIAESQKESQQRISQLEN